MSTMRAKNASSPAVSLPEPRFLAPPREHGSQIPGRAAPRVRLRRVVRPCRVVDQTREIDGPRMVVAARAAARLRRPQPASLGLREHPLRLPVRAARPVQAHLPPSAGPLELARAQVAAHGHPARRAYRRAGRPPAAAAPVPLLLRDGRPVACAPGGQAPERVGDDDVEAFLGDPGTARIVRPHPQVANHPRQPLVGVRVARRRGRPARAHLVHERGQHRRLTVVDGPLRGRRAARPSHRAPDAGRARASATCAGPRSLRGRPSPRRARRAGSRSTRRGR